ncbi:MAG: hypothetical protein EBR32_05740, partial [Bacteroidetes bacterium]|nr:hypothetical protein [Bacteroidota bacterium]
MGHYSDSDPSSTRGHFEQRTLLETSRILIESQDPDFILNNLLLIALGKLMVAHACVIYHRPGEGSYKIAKGKGRFAKNNLYEIRVAIEPEKLTKGVYSIEELPGIFEQLELSRKGLIFHLRTSAHHIGFLCLDASLKDTAYQSDELDFIESLCLMTSVALSSSKMFEELKRINRRLDRKVHDLNSLFELSNDFNQMRTIDELTRTLKFALLGQLFIRQVLLIFYTDEQTHNLVKAGIQEEPKGLDIQSLFLVKDKLKVPLAENEEHNLDTNSITDDTSISTDWIRYFNTQQIQYLIPIQSQGQNLGIIGIGKKGSGEDFDPDELDYVASLANLVVLNIKRIQLLEEQILNEQYESELALARTIQEGLLPANLPAITGLEVSATNIPSKQIGGDYYDLFQLPDGGHLISIADVTGKGVPAALLMANLQAMIHALALQDTTLEEATGTINDFIYNHTPSDKFITFFWAKLLFNGSTLRYVNAGHDYPLWFRASNSGMDHFQTEPTELKDGGLLLGAIPTLQPYGITEIELACDDILVFFTDGVTEAMNPETQEEFGLERLIQLVQNNRNQSAEAIKDKIIT